VTPVLGGPGINNVGYPTIQLLDRICFPNTVALDYFNGQTFDQLGTAMTNLMSNSYLSNFINDIKNVK
jgi:hypothetical protein